MQRITFDCEIITPMFLAGVDGVMPELRAPSIKGAMRFWWRALNGHLRLPDLKKQEGAIFGDTENRSKFSIQVQVVETDIKKAPLLPHKGRVQKCIEVGSTFKVILTVPVETEIWTMKKCQALFELVCWLGDFGKRARRGMGSVNITEINGKPNAKLASLENIIELLKDLNLHHFYNIEGNKIKFRFNGQKEYYPWLSEIQIGQADDDILRTIGQTTHDLKEGNVWQYEASLGHASKGRFASPIYVSVVKGSLKPLISTLNTIPDREGRDISFRLQDEFKKRILK